METKEGIDDSSRYALGALLSLALHLQEVSDCHSSLSVLRQLPLQDCRGML